jgi:NAD(P)-dependent dehydrogenase (short-subunit alcohol dehydrogenase family)
MTSTTSATRTLLLLGYGSRVAVGIKNRFLAAGYNVATVSRRAQPDANDAVKESHIVSDLSDPTNIDTIFDKVTTIYGPVSTVIYNGEAELSTADPRGVIASPD